MFVHHRSRFLRLLSVPYNYIFCLAHTLFTAQEEDLKSRYPTIEVLEPIPTNEGVLLQKMCNPLDVFTGLSTMERFHLEKSLRDAQSMLEFDQSQRDLTQSGGGEAYNDSLTTSINITKIILKQPGESLMKDLLKNYFTSLNKSDVDIQHFI